LVRTCIQCQEAAKSPIKTTLKPWPLTGEVYERVHIDFAGPCKDGNTYLLVTDAFSKWPDVFRMKTISAKDTVDTMRILVNRYGIPKEIVSDNGTQLKSKEFRDFCSEFGIKHTFTPPFHPQSNGQIERFVDTFKRAMQKCKEEGPKWAEKMLLAYRTTPHSALDGHSPDQIFLGRRIRTKLSLLHPISNNKNECVIENDRQKYTNKMAQQFDLKNGAKLVEFTPGESIFLLNYRFGKTQWIPGTILERVGNSPTYRVEVPMLKRVVHRHANQMRRRLPMEFAENREETTPENPLNPPQNCSPHRRYPIRHRTKTKVLQIDPSKSRYEEQ
jgi:hypothetical protein